MLLLLAVTLVNLSATHVREVVLQAGVFSEHTFVRASYQTRRTLSADEVGLGHMHETQFREALREQLVEQTTEIGAQRLAVRLEPGAHIRLNLEMERHVNTPSYAMPW